MKILYVLPQLPFPADRGGKVVIHNMIEYMRQRHEVGVVALTHRPEDVEAAETYRSRVADLWTYPCPAQYSPGTVLHGAVSGTPLKALRFRNPRMEDRVEALCRSGGYDLVHAQNYYAAQYIRRDDPLAKVHYKENFEGLLLARRAATHRNPGTRAFLGMESRKTRRFEIGVARRFDRVYTITETDLERLREAAPDLPLEYQPASIDTEAFRPGESPPDPDETIFVGTLDYFPNADGLLWFHREVLPAILRGRGTARLAIVGRPPEGGFEGLRRDPAVRFTGWVESVAPEVHRASVYVVPLRVGGGVRLKILEAMALGKAIVTTSVGCEGIECRAGEDLLIADRPEDFAAAVLRLLETPAERERLERNARARVVERYSMSRVLPGLEESYRETVAVWKREQKT